MAEPGGLPPTNQDPTQPPGVTPGGLPPREHWGTAGTNNPDGGSGPLGWLYTIAARIGAVVSPVAGSINAQLAQIITNTSAGGGTSPTLTKIRDEIGDDTVPGSTNVQLSTIRGYLNLAGTGLAALVGTVVGQTLASLLDSIKTNTSSTATNTGAGGALATHLDTLHTDAGTTLHGDLSLAGVGLATLVGALSSPTSGSVNARLAVLDGDLSLAGVGLATLVGALSSPTSGSVNARLAVLDGDLGTSGVLHGDLAVIDARLHMSTAGVTDIVKLIAANNRTLLTGTLLVLTGAGRLFRAVVQVAPSAGITFYDNTSAAGVSVLFIPASAAAGTIYEVQCPMTVGIYASFAGTGTVLVTFAS